jgi:hypothetical protein
MPPIPVKLTPEELAVISMMRRNTYQEIIIQVQDKVIASVNQTLKYKRKKGGGLVAGVMKRAPLQPSAPFKLSNEEITIIKMVREKPFQQIAINIQNGDITSLNQTLKYRKIK